MIHEQWDILSNGGLVQEMAHIANGRDPGNSVSLLRVNVGFLLISSLSVQSDNMYDEFRY